jgi:hypothetical protein
VAIWRLSRESACYKMMIVKGVLDMLCLPICGIATGIMGILGTVNCSLPVPTMYMMGATAFGRDPELS